MSKISAVSQAGIKVANRNTLQDVILISVLIVATGLLQGCGNKGDLFRESDAAAVDGLQEAADKLRNLPVDPADDDEDEDEKKPVKKLTPVPVTR